MFETSTAKSETASTETTTSASRPAVVLTELDKFRIQRDAILARSTRRLF